MRNASREVDAYIAESADFARPILVKVRKLFHDACPRIEETMKWSFPHFQYKGIVGSMAAFKQHVGFDFWKAELMRDPHGLLRTVGKTDMGAMKVTSLSEMPPDTILIESIKEAVQLNEDGVKTARTVVRRDKDELEVPDYFMAALRKNKKALATFESFGYCHRKEYVEWVEEAKQETTRRKRLETAVEWMADGKPRNWKYMKDRR